MSYIQPNSRIEFFTDLGLSQDYNDTLYFPTIADKDTYFTNLTKLAYVDRCYYARENRGFVRVELPMSTLIRAQYMRFKNTSYENKWWYAFVTDVNYINDNTTEVTFELDYMMTWMGSFSLSECFVERQHSLTDAIGDNIVEEALSTGDTVINSFKRMLGNDTLHRQGATEQQTEYIGVQSDDGWTYIIAVIPGGTNVPEGRSGLYSGLSFRYVKGLSNITDLNDEITDVLGSGFIPWIQDEDKIQFIMLVPTAFTPSQLNMLEVGPNEYASTIPHSFGVGESDSGVGGYGTPARYSATGEYVRNNKLYTYPYNYLSIDNSEGKEKIYRYEFFKSYNGAIVFTATGLCGAKSEVSIIPQNYKLAVRQGENDADQLNYQEQLTMNSFPMIAWQTDTFKAFMAQVLSDAASTALRTSLITGLAVGSAGMTGFEGLDGTQIADLGRASSAISGALEGTSSLLKGATDTMVHPRDQHGSATIDLMVALKSKDFWARRKSVSYDYAKAIDNYFTMYGYADRTVHTPNMNARPYFTYVKTIGCKINCECPASDADFIENLFNKGIRFWKNHTNIGNYSLDNRPV